MKIRFSFGSSEVPEYILEYALQAVKDALAKNGLYMGAFTINADTFDESGQMRSFIDESEGNIKELNIVVRREPYKTKNRANDLLCTFPPEAEYPEVLLYWQRKEPQYIY